ncbi:MAG TPA: hypothetical protein VFG23_05405 [Polyangia bacterium]|nr:hypothetical protein [Polyangia bacterium]
MNPAALIAHVQGLGVVLRADGDVLRFRPAEKVTPELRAQLLTAKAEILALLRTPAGPYVADPRRCAGCGRGGFVVMVVTGCGDHLCRGCWASTTKLPDIDQPPTPDLDRLTARRDARAEGDRA